MNTRNTTRLFFTSMLIGSLFAMSFSYVDNAVDEALGGSLENVNNVSQEVTVDDELSVHSLDAQINDQDISLDLSLNNSVI